MRDQIIITAGAIQLKGFASQTLFTRSTLPTSCLEICHKCWQKSKPQVFPHRNRAAIFIILIVKACGLLLQVAQENVSLWFC